MIKGFLNDSDWKNCVKSIPITAIDLIISRNNQDILMGKRLNPPAKGLFFVPGGRVYKNETIENAFERIVKEETGLDLKFYNSNLFGIYQHFYNDSIWESSEVSTHYIVLAYKISIINFTKLNLTKQHKSSRWIKKVEISDENIHHYSREYLKDLK